MLHDSGLTKLSRSPSYVILPSEEEITGSPKFILVVMPDDPADFHDRRLPAAFFKCVN